MKRYSPVVLIVALASFFPLSVTGTVLPFYSGVDWHVQAFMARILFDQLAYEEGFHGAPLPSIEPLVEEHGAEGSIPVEVERVMALGESSFLEVSGSSFINVTKGVPSSFSGRSDRDESLFISSCGDLLLRLGDSGYSHLFQSDAYDPVSKSLKLMALLSKDSSKDSSKEECSGCPDEVVISTGHHEILDMNVARHQCFDHTKGAVRCLLPPAGESIDAVLDKTGKVEVTRFYPEEVRENCQAKNHDDLFAVIHELSSYSGYKADQHPVQQLEIWVLHGTLPEVNDNHEDGGNRDADGACGEGFQQHAPDDSGLDTDDSDTEASHEDNEGLASAVGLSQSQASIPLQMLSSSACNPRQGERGPNHTECSTTMASRVQSEILLMPHPLWIIPSPPVAHSNAYRATALQPVFGMSWYHAVPGRPDLASSWDPNYQRMPAPTTGSVSANPVSVRQEAGVGAAGLGYGNPVFTREDGTQTSGNNEHRQRETHANPAVMQSRGSRSTFSEAQLSVMEDSFAQTQYPNFQKCEEIGKKIGLTKTQVKTWFQNRRAKDKRLKLKSSGVQEVSGSSYHDDNNPPPPGGLSSGGAVF